MRNGFLGLTVVLLIAAGSAQAQTPYGNWGQYQQPYLPPYPPPGYPPPYMPVYSSTGMVGYLPTCSSVSRYQTSPPPLANPPATAVPESPPASLTSAAPAAACGPKCAEQNTCGPELYDYVDGGRDRCIRYWVSAEYLYWWAKAAPSSAPLVTTGSPTDAIPGALGQPNTRVLFGGNNISLPGMNGVRATLGGWIDDERMFGLEASGFVFENAVVNSLHMSNAGGSPVLAVPIAIPGFGESAVPISNPLAQANPLTAGSTTPGVVPTTGPYSGTINVALASQLWGAELNLYRNLFRNCGVTVDVLGGVRYLNLQESLTVNAASTEFGTGTTNVYYDSFQAGNQFIGGQLGLRAGYQYYQWSICGSLKAAFGANFESIGVNGNTSQTFAGVTTNYAGGILTQPSNIGNQSSTAFSIVPQLQLKIAYDITPYIRVFAGYDFLYWSNVVRASNQFDHNVNPTQAYGGTLLGSPNPAPMFNQSNYFAQGVSGGLEIRW